MTTETTIDNSVEEKRMWMKGEVWKGTNGVLYTVVRKSKIKNSIVCINQNEKMEVMSIDQFETRIK